MFARIKQISDQMYTIEMMFACRWCANKSIRFRGHTCKVDPNARHVWARTNILMRCRTHDEHLRNLWNIYLPPPCDNNAWIVAIITRISLVKVQRVKWNDGMETLNLNSALLAFCCAHELVSRTTARQNSEMQKLLQIARDSQRKCCSTKIQLCASCFSHLFLLGNSYLSFAITAVASGGEGGEDGLFPFWVKINSHTLVESWGISRCALCVYVEHNKNGQKTFFIAVNAINSELREMHLPNRVQLKVGQMLGTRLIHRRCLASAGTSTYISQDL